MHSLFFGPEKLDRLKETSRHVEEDGQLLLKKEVGGRQSVLFSKLGYGHRYSLDYCEPHELDQLIKYSAKVAYVTKPFKAPRSKRFEIEEFMHTNPRLSRPFGSNQHKLPSFPDGYGEEVFLEERAQS